MGQSHSNIFVDKYKVRTSESLEWDAEAGWVLANQWMEILKIQRTTQEIERFSLKAQPSPPYAKTTRPFGILWEWIV